ncbi:MAG: MFS transporter [Bryobacterales bacterium]|nr:MFS transporter [Bryobacterales bacterium]
MNSRMRWWIGGLLFVSTTINYIDRQTLSVLAPYLKTEFTWTNSDFALIVVAFRVAYAVGQTAAGRVLDRLGTRKGLTLSVIWYSIAAMATSLATGLRSFAAFRFLLGLGEAANWPGAAKTVSEWFPASERGWAVAVYDSGSAVGGAIAPLLVIWLYKTFGSWQPAFLITGTLGFLWVIAWRATVPAKPPAASLDTPADAAAEAPNNRPAPMLTLLRLPETWGIILGKSLTDPVWFFVTDWFAIYLVAKGFKIEDSALGFWVPFLAADLGNFFGGGLSSWLIHRGWNVAAARKFVILICGLGMSLLAFAAFASNFAVLIALFAVSTFAYAAWSTMALALPADLYPSASVASVSGMSGTGAGIGTILSTLIIGRVADRYSFEPILIGASIVPLLATGLVFLLIRGERRTGER